MDYDLRHPPVPYEEKRDGSSEWKREFWDRFLPQKGFITDFVYATRGIETPTNFCAWSAIALLSAMFKRDFWLKWFPGVIYCNLYILFVAPPRICPKSTAINIAEKYVSRKAIEHIEDPVIRAKKVLNTIHSRATMEALYLKMKPQVATPWVMNGDKKEVETVPLGSKLSIIVDEFTTFLGKQQYNVGLVDKLTSWYDCKDEDDSNTVSGGEVELEDIYVTILGGTTFDGLKLSIPQEALNGGFISRLIMVMNKRATRNFPFPVEIQGAPSFDELGKRLAWILTCDQGEYTFSPEAREAYKVWYGEFKQKLEKGVYGEMDRSRTDTNILKLCPIMTAQRYSMERIVTLEDFEDARRLVEATIDPMDNPLEDIGTSVYEKIFKSVTAKFAREGVGVRTTYRTILRSVGPEKKGGNALHVRMAIEQLWGEERIKAYSPNNGKILEKLIFGSYEEYEWLGEE